MDQQTLLSDTPKNLIKKYRKILKNNNIPVEKLILFGSFAKNTQYKGSDLDLCVVSHRFGKQPFAEMVMLAKFAAQVDSLIEAHPYSPKDLDDKWDPLANEIRKYGVVVE